MNNNQSLIEVSDPNLTIQPYQILPKISPELDHITVKISQSWGEQLRCKYNSAEVYHKYYKIFFTDGACHLNQKIEPYPHRFLMACGNDNKLLGSIGLYTHDCYVTRFGNVTTQEIQDILTKADVADYYDPTKVREITKVAINDEKKGIAKMLLSFAHSTQFFNPEESTTPYLLLICGTKKIFKNFWDALGINTRFIKTFPYYKVHEYYRSPENPMESRLIIPKLDIPEHISNHLLPFQMTTKDPLKKWKTQATVHSQPQ